MALSRKLHDSLVEIVCYLTLFTKRAPQVREDLRSSHCIYSFPPARKGFYLDELLCITRIGVPAWKSMRRAIVGLKSLASTRRL